MSRNSTIAVGSFAALMALSVSAAAIGAEPVVSDEDLERLGTSILEIAGAEPRECPVSLMITGYANALCGLFEMPDKGKTRQMRREMASRIRQEGGRLDRTAHMRWMRRGAVYRGHWSFGTADVEVIINEKRGYLVYLYGTGADWKLIAEKLRARGARSGSFCKVSEEPPAVCRPDQDVIEPRQVRASFVNPVFPEEAKRQRLEGQVVLRGVIDITGAVTELEVLSVDHPGVGFEEAAIEAVRQWRYEPATSDGEPVEMYVTFTVEFSLH